MCTELLGQHHAPATVICSRSIAKLIDQTIYWLRLSQGYSTARSSGAVHPRHYWYVKFHSSTYHPEALSYLPDFLTLSRLLSSFPYLTLSYFHKYVGSCGSGSSVRADSNSARADSTSITDGAPALYRALRRSRLLVPVETRVET